jgi:hypothetical protein
MRGVKQAVSGPGLELHAGCPEGAGKSGVRGGRVHVEWSVVPSAALPSDDGSKPGGRAHREEAAGGMGSMLIWGQGGEAEVQPMFQRLDPWSVD